MFTYNQLFPIKFNERYAFTLNGGLSEAGKEAIKSFLYGWIYRNTPATDGEAYNASFGLLTDEFFEDKPNQPRLTKRVSKALMLRGYNVPRDVLTEMGNMANNYNIPTRTLELVFTDHMNGGPEDYFNERSCWWTDYWKSRDWLVYNGGGAILAYNGEKLVGRALHAPSRHGNMLIFNTYGDVGLPIVWATAVSGIFAGTKPQIVTWREEGHGYAYFNSRDNTGYVNSVDKAATTVEAFWVQPPRYTYNRWKCCDSCERRVDETTLEGGLCEECRRDFEPCAKCGMQTHESDMTRVDVGMICIGCRNAHYRACHSCREYHPVIEMTRDHRRFATYYCSEHANQIPEEPRNEYVAPNWTPPNSGYVYERPRYSGLDWAMEEPRQFAADVGRGPTQGYIWPEEPTHNVDAIRRAIEELTRGSAGRAEEDGT